MPKKGASRARRRPTSSCRPLPLELVAKILEYLRVGDDSGFPWHDMDCGTWDLANCSLVSRVWHQAANAELYRFLTIGVKVHETDDDEAFSDDGEGWQGRPMITNSHNLEASLLRFPHLGASTRRVIVHAEDLRSRGDELNAETVAVRSLGIVLLCCPRLVALEIESFNTSASFVLAELAACRQPKLEELSISDVMAGSEEEGRFVKLLDSLPCLRKLDVFSLPLDADGSPAQDDASPALTSSLTSLNVVGLYSNEVIRALPLRFASALTTLTFSISEDPDLGSPDLDRFTNLRSLAFDLPEPSNIVPVLELIEQLSDLPRLESLRVGMQGPWSANLHIDWSGLPTTLTTISLVTVDLCWSSIAKLLASPGREACKISWSEINWSKENQSKMEKLVGKEDPLRQRYVLESGRLVLLE